MPRGQPDFGMYAVKEVSASISDMGEVAARLGSIVTYDKRGDVVDFDNFEEPILKWQLGFWGAGNVAVLSTTSQKSGSQSVALSAPNVIFSGSHIARRLSVLGTKRLGNEISFSNVNPLFLIYHEIYQYTGTHLVRGYTVFNLATGVISLLHGTDGEVPIANFGDFFPATDIYYTTKLVIDIDKGKYVRLLLGSIEYNIEDYPLEILARPLIAPMTQVQFGIETLAAAGETIYADDWVITQAEP